MTPARSEDATLRHVAIMAVVFAAVFLLFSLICSVAGADPLPAAPAPAASAGWSMGEVLALIALLVASVGAIVDAVRAVLHFTAPRTTSTLDDRAAAALDKVHDRLTAIEGKLPPPAA